MEPRVMAVFVDALGPAALTRLSERLPWLTHRRALQGELGYSSGALATILTGEAPAQHGRMCLFTRRADDDPPLLAPLRWLGLLPRWAHERGRVRRFVASAFGRSASITGYFALHRVPPEAFTWLDVPERDDLFQASTVGGCPTFLARARAAGVGVTAARWQLPEAARWDAALASLRAHGPRLAFLYATDLDAVLHHEGASSRSADGVFDAVAARIDRARETLAASGAPVITLVIGDHGMADVSRIVDPRPLVAALGGVRVFVDSTMLRLWGPPRALGAARSAVERAGLPGTWLDRDALAARGSPVTGDPYGAAIFLLDEGGIFAPSYVGGRVRGMHGYDVGSASAAAALASDAPLPAGALALRDVSSIVTSALEIA